jgi:hypothetical protein
MLALHWVQLWLTYAHKLHLAAVTVIIEGKHTKANPKPLIVCATQSLGCSLLNLNIEWQRSSTARVSHDDHALDRNCCTETTPVP